MAKKNMSLSEKQELLKERNVNKSYRNLQLNNAKGVIALVIGIMLLITLVNIFRGRTEIPTFRSLLQYLTTAPNFASSQIFTRGLIGKLSEGGIFWFLVPIINALIDIINFLVFLGGMLVNGVTYILWFLGWIFGF